MSEEDWEKMKVNELGRQNIRKAIFPAVSEACKAIFWPTERLKERDL